MSRTNIAPQTLAGSYPALPISAHAADFTETATDDPTDRVTPLVNGKTVVLAHNTNNIAGTITISSVADQFNRTGDITAYSIDAGKIARFGPFNSAGWASAGNLNIDVSDSTIRLTILTLP